MRAPLQVWVSRCAALLAALVLPPVFVALRGGADLDLPIARVRWYDVAGPAVALVSALFAASVELGGVSSRSRSQAIALLQLTGLVGLGLAVGAATLGGFQTDWISVRHALRPALLAALALGAAFGLALREKWATATSGGAQVTLARAAVALIAGALATFLALRADRAELRERIESALRGDAHGVDVVFVVVDTLRADAVGFAESVRSPDSGSPPDLLLDLPLDEPSGALTDSPTPEMDAMARRSLVFENAFSQAPWTLPSMMSMWSSRYASSLHAGWRGAWPTRVAPPADSALFAERLRDSGYHTAGFVKNPMLARGTGFERGYDVYEWVGGEDADGHSARQLVDAALRWGR